MPLDDVSRAGVVRLRDGVYARPEQHHADGVRREFRPGALDAAHGRALSSASRCCCAPTGGGLGALIVAFPAIQIALKIVGAAYMLWLAWKVANAGRAGKRGGRRARPLTFLQAAAFQWVNPKG